MATACARSNRVASPPTSATGPAVGAVADVTVSKCKQDPTDPTQVIASGSLTDHSSAAADYSFTVEWYLGSMLVTRNSVSKTGVPPNAPLGWTTETGVALPSSGPYACRITRVIKTPES